METLRLVLDELPALREFYAAWSEYNASNNAEERLGAAVDAVIASMTKDTAIDAAIAARQAEGGDHG